jgi:hypothetical protein
MKEDLNKRIEETLSSIDHLQRAEANPFLYGRVRNRLEAWKTFVPKQMAWRMVIALLAVAVINLSTIFHLNSEKQKKDGAQLVAKEYSISLPQAY